VNDVARHLCTVSREITNARNSNGPRTAALFRRALVQDDWVELDGVVHRRQLDLPLGAAQLILG
jgi:hypothetical protein